ncbi:MAG TPA: serine/threonine-protein kinase [Streptosporangiaceae bacterium]|nr:serine/threonine-protein kinase [Streptosporangiaceae bacterium]
MEPTSMGMAGRYRLEERIAAGGVGEVWRGRDTVLDRVVAVKLLRPEYTQHPETLARFRAEARHTASLSHPGIAQVYDYGQGEDGQPFLVMELIDGPSLATVLARGPLDAATTMDIVYQTAAALAAAHTSGLVHRDIKPANLLLAPGGHVKVTDFGIAYAAGSAPLTRTGALIGTPAYLAPERVAGGAATPASDLYSLGVVCYECLTGEPPFSGTPLETALAHQHGRLPPLPLHVPAQVTVLVTTLTAKDPTARPASAAEVARWASRLRDELATGSTDRPTGWHGPAPTGSLHPTLTGLPSDTMAIPQPDSVDKPPPSHLHRRWTVLLAAVAVALAAGLAGWLLRGTPSAASQGHHAPAGVHSTPPQLVDVNPSLLDGQPVSAVRQQLTQLGLQVQVEWHHSGNQPGGTVISVEPSGQLPRGTPVVVTGALEPPGHDHGGGNSGNGN